MKTGMGVTEIAKALKIGSASVYRAPQAETGLPLRSVRVFAHRRNERVGLENRYRNERDVSDRPRFFYVFARS
jgi:hypothetical protein